MQSEHGLAHKQLDALWEGRVADALAALALCKAKGEGVALSHYTTHQARIDYLSYRARGFQIGSGPVESACKQLARARLKLAGMIWDAEGAEAVAAVQVWLKSERWNEALRLRPSPHRMYRREAAPPTTATAAA